MCINCLTDKLSAIDKYENEVNEFKNSIQCECCISYHNFLLGVNDDLKILCLTKIKRNHHVCPRGIMKLFNFENMVKLRIKNKLNDALEYIDEKKDCSMEQNYIIKMNDLKALNDFLEEIEKADHN
jgi:hypothetical protein